MKRVFLSSAVLIMAILFTVNISALATEACNLQVSLLNQDPYPAAPGDYVKLVFQVTGTDNPSCGTMHFNFLQNYPFTLDPNVPASVDLAAGGYVTDFGTFFLVPFKVKIDSNAIDSEYPLKVSYTTSSEANRGVSVSNFTIAVNQTSTDFDLTLDYVSSTNALTFDILNIGKNDAEALVIQLPEQAGLNFSDGNKKIIGKLNRGDDTTATFTATPTGNDIKVNLFYNDATGVRRSVEKTVSFSSNNFQTQVKATGRGTYFYLFVITWVLIVVFFIYGRYKNKKKSVLRK